MKYLDEFSDPGLARKLLDQIHAVTTRPWAMMEVCGGQTHSIIRPGIDQPGAQQAERQPCRQPLPETPVDLGLGAIAACLGRVEQIGEPDRKAARRADQDRLRPLRIVNRIIE